MADRPPHPRAHARTRTAPCTPTVVVDNAATVGTRLADGAYVAWQAAKIECELAFKEWQVGERRRATAHIAYRAALDREEAAARDFEMLSRLTARMSALRAA
jgi:hypothetical protein